MPLDRPFSIQFPSTFNGIGVVQCSALSHLYTYAVNHTDVRERQTHSSGRGWHICGCHNRKTIYHRTPIGLELLFQTILHPMCHLCNKQVIRNRNKKYLNWDWNLFANSEQQRNETKTKVNTIHMQKLPIHKFNRIFLGYGGGRRPLGGRRYWGFVPIVLQMVTHANVWFYMGYCKIWNIFDYMLG